VIVATAWYRDIFSVGKEIETNLEQKNGQRKSIRTILPLGYNPVEQLAEEQRRILTNSTADDTQRIAGELVDTGGEAQETWPDLAHTALITAGPRHSFSQFLGLMPVCRQRRQDHDRSNCWRHHRVGV